MLLYKEQWARCQRGKREEGRTRSRRRKERRDTRPSRTDPLRQRPLRTQLNPNRAGEVLVLEDLVVAEEREDQAAQLA